MSRTEDPEITMDFKELNPHGPLQHHLQVPKTPSTSGQRIGEISFSEPGHHCFALLSLVVYVLNKSVRERAVCSIAASLSLPRLVALATLVKRNPGKKKRCGVLFSFIGPDPSLAFCLQNIHSNTKISALGCRMGL